jgi:hypothetical protein
LKQIEPNSTTDNRGGETKKTTFFVMSPDGFSRKKFFFVFLNSPCYETPKKRVEKIDKKIKIK